MGNGDVTYTENKSGVNALFAKKGSYTKRILMHTITQL